MSEQKDNGGALVFILLLLVCASLWVNQPTLPSVELTPSPNGLIDEVASVEHTMNHSLGVGEVVDEPKPVPSPSDKPSKPEIIIFTSKSCPPCERWKRCEMQKFLDTGWKVVIVDEKDHSHPRTPTFLITKDGRAIEKVGFFAFEQLQEVLK